MAKQRKKDIDPGLEALEACAKAPGKTRRKSSAKSSAKSGQGGKKSANRKRSGTSKRTAAAKATRKWTALHWGAVVGIALILLGIYCLEFTRVTSNAMMPTLAEGDWVVSWAPRWVDVGFEPGDVVWVNEGESDVASNFLRLIAKDDAEVSYNNDTVRINGVSPERRLLTNDAIVRPLEEPEIWRESLKNGVSWRIMLPQQGLYGDNNGRVALQSDDMFLIGDNRMASYDSRQRGVYTREQVQGRALFVLNSARDDALLGHFIKPL